ncbi:hypothetical protein DB346_20210 [Verrucomicrobia bacterium LW23]|nr:hypothetical protein DB346_20210 [Verrucomicrobia bacterium LW23]
MSKKPAAAPKAAAPVKPHKSNASNKKATEANRKPGVPSFPPVDWGEPLIGVGSVSTLAGLEILQSPAACPADIVEVRVDLLLAKGVTVDAIADALRARRHPALITPRIPSEGGKLTWEPGHREEATRALLPFADALDLELAEIEASPSIRAVYEEALSKGKALILSAHAIARPASKATWKHWTQAFPTHAATVYKIAGLVKSRQDLLNLALPLVTRPDLPWAVMGMGEGAARMRMALTALGSKLIYGYLDEPAVASQPSLVSLLQQFAD